VTSGSWDGEKVILKGQVLEVRNVDGRLYVARKAKKPDASGDSVRSGFRFAAGRVDSLEKVIEKLATTEKTTLAIAREEGGKIRVTSGSWDGEKVILKGQVLQVRNVDGRLYVSRKAKKPDEWDPPIAAYDPYGPGTGVAGDVDFVAGDETSVAGDAGA
jgi:hypothetical protein